jgi:steroid 5-alpha reductase family enzyme
MFETILICWLVIFCFICLIWAGYLFLNNPSLIDTFWSIGIFISGSIFICFQNSFTTIESKVYFYWFCLLIWALRLSVFLLSTRLKRNEVDKRYVELSRDWKTKKSLGFFIQYQFQGVLMVLVSLPFLFIGQNHFPLTGIDYILISLTFLCIVLETISDFQLYRFKLLMPGKVCDQGFWKYSRHPNYFFEWLIWIGFALGALHSPLSYLSFISPLLLIYLFVYVTGPITERSSIQSKGNEYIAYQKRTSMIIPLPPKAP